MEAALQFVRHLSQPPAFYAERIATTQSLVALLTSEPSFISNTIL
jgi:hypothetical protein